MKVAEIMIIRWCCRAEKLVFADGDKLIFDEKYQVPAALNFSDFSFRCLLALFFFPI